MLLTIAQYRMDNDHMDGGWGWFMAVVMILALVALVLLAIWVIRGTAVAAPTASSESARDILDRRLAAGEITPKEYRERLALLEKREP